MTTRYNRPGYIVATQYPLFRKAVIPHYITSQVPHCSRHPMPTVHHQHPMSRRWNNPLVSILSIVMSPAAVTSTSLQIKIEEGMEVFNRTKVYRRTLISVSTPPHKRNYHFPATVHKGMKQYIPEALKFKYICPFTPFTSVGFNFISIHECEWKMVDHCRTFQVLCHTLWAF